ncbi:MAG TPA: aldo/keto reductase [Rhizomicrobium sp.]|nr:aldo/keto reductase [Rhizomicrobium sp.]
MFAADSLRSFTTRAGRTLPFTLLGFGSATLGNLGQVFSEESCDATLARAWDRGLRYFDTAPMYGLGLSETRVGRLLQRRRRGDFLLSTKAGRLLEACAPGEFDASPFIADPRLKYVYDYSYDGVMRSFEASLARLGLSAIDILFIHDVDGFTHGGRDGSEARIQELMRSGGWRAADELRRSGAVAAIGIGVNEWQPCARLLELADPDLFLLAGRYTLLEQAPIETLFAQCARAGAGIVLGGPYNSGVLAGKATFDYAAIPPAVAARVQKLAAICAAHGTPLRAAALQFVAAHPIVVSVIPGAVSAQEVDDNVALLQAAIPAALWRDMKREGLIHADAPVPA